MVLSGGYTGRGAAITERSIENILEAIKKGVLDESTPWRR